MKLNIDNPVFQFINILCSFIALNIIFLITCLPLITIGSALCAMYSVMLKESRGESSYLIRPYLKAFKENFKTSTPAFLYLIFIGMILLFNLAFWVHINSIMGMILSFVIALAFLMYLLVFLYTLPLIARFNNRILQTYKNAFALAISNIKQTLALLLMDLIVVLCCLLIPQMKIFMILLGFSFITYCHGFQFNKVFKPYEIEATLTK